MPFRGALLLALGAAILTSVVLWPRTRGAGWRVDEAHKVSESYALRLVLERRWNDFATMIDRSNGPFGKYAFGLAVLAAGEELPEMPLLSRLPRTALLEPFVADVHARPYLPLLTPCRRVSLFATALTVGLIALVAARTHSALAAVIASAWCGAHWMTSLFGGDAIYDPLLASLVFATLPLVLFCHPEPAKRGEGPPDSGAAGANRRGSFAVFAAQDDSVAMLLGLVCAMAFQTRFNGGIALAAVLAVFLLRRNWKAGLLVGLAFAAATIAMNPYYWPNPIGRFAQEISELRTTLAAVTAGGVRLPLWAADSPARTPIEWTALQKLRFTWIALDGGIRSLALLAGVAAGCWAAVREKSFALLLWCAVVIAGILIWLPLPWARYLLVVLPSLTLLAGLGYAAGLRAAFEAWR